MDAGLRDLYQEVILDHQKAPRNFGMLNEATHSAEGYNPLCGDHINVYLTMDGDVIQDVAFDGAGCAISTASASMMTDMLRGKTRADAEGLFHRFHSLVAEDGPPNDESIDELGKLRVLSGVREFPARVKCATLAWHTLNAALSGDDTPVSTE